jgi:hypothetical protein
VWSGRADFSEASLEWYDDIDNLDRWLVGDGPVDWPRIDTLDARLKTTPLGERTRAVSDVIVDNGRISFSTTAVGVPHLVKVSFFPNWTARGATGPYRAAPSLMVVVPTSEDVVLEFSRGWPEFTGIALTAMALLVLGAWGAVRRRTSRATEGPR